MPPYTSYLLRPLEVGCFEPLKRSNGKRVEGCIHLGINYIDKLEFLAFYKQARMEALNTQNIRNEFEATGLVPYDPDEVLSCLHILMRTPTPPVTTEAAQSNLTSGTTYNVRQLELQTEVVRTSLKLRTQSPSSLTERALNQLLKGC